MRRTAVCLLAWMLMPGCSGTTQSGTDLQTDSGTPDSQTMQWACPDDPLATTETLARKAQTYDDLAVRVHIHPDLKWITDVTLKKVEVDCPGGVAGPCFEPSVPLDQATWQDVERFHTGENDGLWSGLYLASQAFRYGVTQSPDALATIKLLLEGEKTRMAITGVPGVFTRQFIPPGVEGIACTENEDDYVVDVEKDDNKWVQIRKDGCVWVIDNQTMDWTGTSHCGLDEFAGWCWLDNVSQDEYAGHMLALGTIMKLVDDAEVQQTTRQLIEQVGVHLMDNDLTFVDWDGRITEHGLLYPMSLAGTPGFLAAESLSWIRMAIEASGRSDLEGFYDNCLLQKSGEKACLPWDLQTPTPFTDYFDMTFLYIGDDGCKTNFNNVSMAVAAFQGLLMFEHDPELRPLLEAALRDEVMVADNPKAAAGLHNSWYNFAWAAHNDPDPDGDGPVPTAVRDAICTLGQFPATQEVLTIENTSLYPHFCDSRLGASMAQFPIPAAQRCTATFFFWKSPYERKDCTADPLQIHQPGDYLLAYWMGRYYGFIAENM